MKKKIETIEINEVVEEVKVETELEKLQRLHKELTDLGVSRIGQLETLIANLQK